MTDEELAVTVLDNKIDKTKNTLIISLKFLHD